MNGTRMATSRAVAFIFVGVLAGCGFTPKDAPMPDAANAVPVNRVEPDTRPWTEIYPTVVSRAPKPTVEKITLAQDDHLAIGASKAEKQSVPVKPADRVANSDPATSTNKSVPVALPVPIPLPSAATSRTKSVAVTISTIPKQENFEQGHAESASLPKLDTALMKSKGSQTRPFGLPNSKVDPILMAAIAPVSILPARAMVANSRTDARPLPATSFGAVPNAQVQDVLSGKIVTRDLTPSESPPDLEAHLPPAKPPQLQTPQNLTWVASSGTRLSDVVRNWGYQENPHWWVVWNTKADFTIGSPYSIKAPDFLSASAQLFAAARQENHYFTVVKHPNHVLVVSTPTE